MTDRMTLVHATAIVAGTNGYLFLGPSGSGKSRTALACIDDARHEGHFAALIADDQVILCLTQGGLIARCPPILTGQAEIRAAALVTVPHIAAARLHFAVQLVDPSRDQRLPDIGDTHVFADNIALPLLRLPINCPNAWTNLYRIHLAYLAEN
jgi:serine kinase of HPr protein (carbohydrate metabolism regulator)